MDDTGSPFHDKVVAHSPRLRKRRVELPGRLAAKPSVPFFSATIKPSLARDYNQPHLEKPVSHSLNLQHQVAIRAQASRLSAKIQPSDYVSATFEVGVQ
jgi:hypothetical protein